MEKLVRGVIYDDVPVEDFKEEMFWYLDRMDDYEREGRLEEYIEPHAKDLNMSINETIHMFKNMDAIAAITRLNPETFETHNLVIPKESLSKNLVKELSTVDIGKYLVHDYLHHYTETYDPRYAEILAGDKCVDDNIYPEGDFVFTDMETGKCLCRVPSNSELGKELWKATEIRKVG